MNESFDAHYQWLGIPPTEQPPNYYRLLGLSLFEPNEEVIRIAAEQRQTFLRTFQQGHGAERSQKLLNEISQAKVCLLDPLRRSHYDASLQETIPPATNTSATNVPVAAAHVAHASSAAVSGDDVESADAKLLDFEHISDVPSWRRSLSGGLLWGFASSVALLLITGILVAVAVFLQRSQPTEVASGPEIDPTPEAVGSDPDQNIDNVENPIPPVVDGGQESSQVPPTVSPGPPAPPGDVDSQSTETMAPPASTATGEPAIESSTGDTQGPPDDPSKPNSEPAPDTAPDAEPTGISVEPAMLNDARQTLGASYPWTAEDEKGKLLQLFDQMLELADDESQSDVTRLAATLEARSVAWAMIDIPLVTKTSQALERFRDFDLNTIELKGLLSGLTRAETGQDFSQLWWLSHSLTPNLVAEHRFAELEQLWTAFEDAARSDAGRPFRKAIIDHQRQVEEWQARFQELAWAQSPEPTFSSLTPEDHQKIGLWLLEIEHNPQDALAHLSLAAEPQVQALANSELARSDSTAETQLGIAEKWLAFAESLPVPEDVPGSGRYAFKAYALDRLRAIEPAELSESQQERFETVIESVVDDPDYGEIIRCTAPLAGLFCNDLVIGSSAALSEVSGEVSALSITSDGLKIAIGSDAGTNEGQLAVVDLLNQRIVIEPQEMGEAISSVDWFPDDQRLIYAGVGKLLKNWDTRRPINKSTDACPTIPGGINRVAVGPKGRTVVGASNSGTLYFWQGNNGKLLTTIRNHRQEITSLAVSEDGSVMVTGSRDEKAQLWNEQGPLALLNGHSDQIHLADISSDGLFAAIADPSNLVTIWNTADYQKMTEFSVDSGGKLMGIHLLRQAPWILTVTEDGEIGIYDLAYGTWVSRTHLDLQDISQTALSNSGSSLVIGTSEGDVYRINLDARLLPMPRSPSQSQTSF